MKKMLDFRVKLLDCIHQPTSWVYYTGLWAPAYLRKCNIAVMQYMRFNDKSDNKIYEGDIIKTWVDCGPGGTFELFDMIYRTPTGINIQEWTLCEEWAIPEIIGNIFDNPELMEICKFANNADKWEQLKNKFIYNKG